MSDLNLAASIFCDNAKAGAWLKEVVGPAAPSVPCRLRQGPRRNSKELVCVGLLDGRFKGLLGFGCYSNLGISGAL